MLSNEPGRSEIGDQQSGLFGKSPQPEQPISRRLVRGFPRQLLFSQLLTWPADQPRHATYRSIARSNPIRPRTCERPMETHSIPQLFGHTSQKLEHDPLYSHSTTTSTPLKGPRNPVSPLVPQVPAWERRPRSSTSPHAAPRTIPSGPPTTYTCPLASSINCNVSSICSTFENPIVNACIVPKPRAYLIDSSRCSRVFVNPSP